MVSCEIETLSYPHSRTSHSVTFCRFIVSQTISSPFFSNFLQPWQLSQNWEVSFLIEGWFNLKQKRGIEEGKLSGKNQMKKKQFLRPLKIARSTRKIAKQKEVKMIITKGQLISEWLFDVASFPKKQRKNLMLFCPRI